MLTLNLVGGLSRKSTNFILRAFRFVLGLFFDMTLSSMPEPDRQQAALILTDVPRSLESVLADYNLDGDFVKYAICPACHATYEPRYLPGSDQAIYDEECSNIPLERPHKGYIGPLIRCKERLLNDLGHPRKVYAHHRLADWIASTLSVPELERHVDRACDVFMASLPDGSPKIMKNPFDAAWLKTFKLGDKLFLDRGDEVRLVFVKNFDSFTIEGIGPRGPHTSIGIMSFVCLNLPPDIRMKPENMYVAGIIPGPTEPSVTQIGHYMKPVFQESAASWTRGYHISRTASSPEGRVARTALAISANDLIAARKASGSSASTSHIFCPRCKVWETGEGHGNLPCNWKDQYGRTDFNHPDWKPRDLDELRKLAEMVRDSTSYDKREEILMKYGLRWSEYWILPYWDPTRQLIVDGMHCLLEGLVKDHIRTALQLSFDTAAEPEGVPAAFEYDWPKLDDRERVKYELNEKLEGEITKIRTTLTSFLAMPAVTPDSQLSQTMPTPLYLTSRAPSLVESDADRSTDCDTESAFTMNEVEEDPTLAQLSARQSNEMRQMSPSQVEEGAALKHTRKTPRQQRAPRQQRNTLAWCMSRLMSVTIPALDFVIRELGLETISAPRKKPSKADRANTLLTWVSRFPCC